jgi:serine/threonine protein kinase
MEICNGNLEDYIKGIRPQRFETALNPLFDNLGIGQIGEIASIWDIMEQIACGLCFIHSCREVHRDLKPRNSRSTMILALAD